MVINKDISGNPVYVDENRKIYNSIFTFKKGVPTNDKIADFFEMRIVFEAKNVTGTSY